MQDISYFEGYELKTPPATPPMKSHSMMLKERTEMHISLEKMFPTSPPQTPPRLGLKRSFSSFGVVTPPTTPPTRFSSRPSRSSSLSGQVHEHQISLVSINLYEEYDRTTANEELVQEPPNNLNNRHNQQSFALAPKHDKQIIKLFRPFHHLCNINRTQRPSRSCSHLLCRLHRLSLPFSNPQLFHLFASPQHSRDLRSRAPNPRLLLPRFRLLRRRHNIPSLWPRKRIRPLHRFRRPNLPRKRQSDRPRKRK